ncbi:MAG: phosphoenolpyruvate carboxylase [Deltaproteobacteria bacterium]|nr:phosphoenolpyruvate carboxylase [Deltaproteobacteria bacterium]
MTSQIERSYKDLVELKYHLYNSLFLTLPLDAIQQAGTLLPLLQEACVHGLKDGVSPTDIIDIFLEQHRPRFTEPERISFLFKVIQYVERQIVLIDALEDAVYNSIHRVAGEHSWKHLVEGVHTKELCEHAGSILNDMGIRVVLTAHPTQFYPETVLQIIDDLMTAVNDNAAGVVRDILQQLGRTPFFQKHKPSPFDEAVRLASYLEKTFYPAIGELLNRIGEVYPDVVNNNRGLFQLGFWPGGDRDGNPNVTVETTLKTAALLRGTLVKCYLQDVRKLKRRLSFTGVYEKLTALELALHEEISNVCEGQRVSLDDLCNTLNEVETLVINHHQGLYLHKILSLKRKVLNFGLYFASLDIRQDSRVIDATFAAVMMACPHLLPPHTKELSRQEQATLLFNLRGNINPDSFNDPVIRDTLQSFQVIRKIQSENGEQGANRYIISNCRDVLDIARVFALLRLCGWSDQKLTVDIVPLFETINDLKAAPDTMKTVYHINAYRDHLKERGNHQTVMLGFSDGTKDGGYLMANWSIYRARESMTAVSREAGISAVFFDGRGGPPARGGGNTHLFYAAMGPSVENKQIQLTLQGQTISSHYGIREAAIHNLELLLTAGVKSRLFDCAANTLTHAQRELINIMAESSYRKYMQFKTHPLFVPYLLERSTLKFYGMVNISSRPTKRGKGQEFNFEDLRAIPFVGAWSQSKQNVPGYFGVGTALKEQEDLGNWDECVVLYRESALFRTIISNSMQSLCKTNLDLTRSMERDPRFGGFWKIIFDEYKLTKSMVLKIAGQKEFLEDNPRSRLSVNLRETIVLPLLVIQQYALIKIQQQGDVTPPEYKEKYAKMVARSLYGNVNASRNSV